MSLFPFATQKDPFANDRNWDSDVRKDMIDALDKLAPEKANYRHNAEGSDDMVLPSLVLGVY